MLGGSRRCCPLGGTAGVRARIAPGGGHVVMRQHGRHASHRFGELFVGQVRASTVHRQGYIYQISKGGGAFEIFNLF